MVPGFEDELVRQLSALVNLLARGEAPSEAQPYFCGASLVALLKEDSTHRLIAVGETIRRLVSKSLAIVVKDDARDLLEPLQITTFMFYLKTQFVLDTDTDGTSNRH